jgi:hypothetical protein
MKRTFVTVVLTLVASALASGASAQINDHLECFKIKDPLKLNAVVDLDALQDRFDVATVGLKGCVLAKKATMFCVPVTKSVRPATPPTPATGLVGPPLQTDQLCYKLKCPKPTVTSVQVVDQFAQRQIAGFVPAFLCAPAIKSDATPTCLDSAAPQCAGPCPDPTELCRPKNDGTPGCDCFPNNPPCKQSAPQCNGPCPIAGQQCVHTASGGCFCADADIPCDQTSPPQCNGVCTDGTLCAPNAVGKCECGGGGGPTCFGSFPQCGGTCPNANEVCTNFGASCDCVYTCGFTGPNQCGGTCPVGATCVLDAAVNFCRCQ